MKSLKVTINLKKHAIILSFIIPAIIRAIPEIQFPYPIGFDTPLYFAFAKYHAQEGLWPSYFLIVNPTYYNMIYQEGLWPSYRLFQTVILGGLYTIGIDAVIAMKILPTIIYGFFGLSIYLLAKNYLQWNNTKSLLASIITTLSIANLRISWDMHDLMLGLVFLTLTISTIKKPQNTIAFVIFATLTILAHQLTAIILISILLILTLTDIKDKHYPIRLIILFIGFILFIYFNINYLLKFYWIPTFTYPSFQSIVYESQNILMIMKLYLPILPLFIAGYFKDKIITTWLILALLGSLSTIISPSFLLGGVLPWRYVLLLAVPLAIYTTNTLWKIKIKFSKNQTITIAIILLIHLATFTFLGLKIVPAYYEDPSKIPSNMVQTSIPLYDIEPTITLLNQIKNEQNITLLVYGDFVGWALYYTNAQVIGFGGIYNAGPDLQQVLTKIARKDNLYLLYWNDQEAYLLGFKKISQQGNLALYKYSNLA
jgi:hypothetical protein